jgi:hypothetical protein
MGCGGCDPPFSGTRFTLRGPQCVRTILSLSCPKPRFALLEEAGRAVNIRAPLANDSPRANTALDCPTVSFGYLDAPGVDKAFAALNAALPTLTLLTNLPERTTGYDGAQPAVAFGIRQVLDRYSGRRRSRIERYGSIAARIGGRFLLIRAAC